MKYLEFAYMCGYIMSTFAAVRYWGKSCLVKMLPLLVAALFIVIASGIQLLQGAGYVQVLHAVQIHSVCGIGFLALAWMGVKTSQ